MRRPILGLAAVVMAGMWLGLVAGTPEYMWGVAGCVMAAVLVTHFMRLSGWADFALFFLVFVLAWWRAGSYSSGRIDAIMAQAGVNNGALVTVEARVASDIADMRVYGGRPTLNFMARLSSVELQGKTYQSKDVVRVVMYGLPRYPPVYGELWRIKGRLYPLRARRGAARFGLTTGLRNATRLRHGKSGQPGGLLALHDRCAALLAAGIEKYPAEVGVIQAMLLGFRSQLPKSVRDSFRHTGTMHVFAVSGLHVGVLCAIIVFALAVLGVPRTMWVLALAPIIFGYTVITGSRASAIRAGIMAVAYLAAPLLRRKADAVAAFAFAAIVILFWNPAQLTDVGFIFSFAVVAGILAIVPLFDALTARWWQPDEFMLPEVAAKSAWRRHILRWLTALCSVSLAAWLTSTPLSIYFFGRFSPVALLGNLVAVPMAFLIIVTGCLALAGGLLASGLGVIFNSANLFFVKLLVGSMGVLEKIPYGWVDCGHLPLWGVFLWYLVLISGIVMARRRMSGKIPQ